MIMAFDRPSVSPVSSSTQINPLSLPAKINTSTRAKHLQLNRLIIARLPLALPPYSQSPSLYVNGLLYIAPIYRTFESLWLLALEGPHLSKTRQNSFDVSPPSSPLLGSQIHSILRNTDGPHFVRRPNVCTRTHSLLALIYIPGLLRSGQLCADLGTLTGIPDHQVEDQLSVTSRNGKLAFFLNHIEQSINANPHVLLAYTWVLYMALFSGGRYLRSSLQSAGPEFWTHSSASTDQTLTSPEVPEEGYSTQSDTWPPCSPRTLRTAARSHKACPQVPGLQFFNFPGNQDGEDIKHEFKARFAEAEMLLSEDEKTAIVTEAQRIFEFMVEIVEELDAVCETGDSGDALLFAKKEEVKLRKDGDLGGVERARIGMHVLEEKPPCQRESSSSLMGMLVASPVAAIVGFDEVVPKIAQAAAGLGVRAISARPLEAVAGLAGDVLPRGGGRGHHRPVMVTRRRLSMADWDGVLFMSLTSMIPVFVLFMALLAWRYIPS